ncbi:Zn-ribbon domain-containing OB-fold protein [Halocatena marina]|uniref:Zn-ribbon domain-containing OB-fold protein n=1 Tax=Halocatena marina TaxID=2934937 RepID=A0ABD5YWM2_9EURY|nr:OB-fold domain-containing protein [Halocatena marina]
MSDREGHTRSRHERFLDAIADGEGYYLADDDGNGYVPPRAVDPIGGTRNLTQEPLPETGEIESYTVVHVPPSEFEADAPYALAIVDMGRVRLTGQVCDCDLDDVDIGLTVSPAVVTTNNEERVLTFTSQENA